MKKIKILFTLSTLIFSVSLLSETNNIIEDEQCVLIKENKLIDYLPENEVNNFLENRFIDKIETETVVYSIEEINRRINKRIKTYKVCAEYKRK